MALEMQGGGNTSNELEAKEIQHRSVLLHLIVSMCAKAA